MLGYSIERYIYTQQSIFQQSVGVIAVWSPLQLFPGSLTLMNNAYISSVIVP